MWCAISDYFVFCEVKYLKLLDTVACYLCAELTCLLLAAWRDAVKSHQFKIIFLMCGIRAGACYFPTFVL